MFGLSFFKKNPVVSDRFLTISISSDAISCLLIYKDNDIYKAIAKAYEELPKNAVRNGQIINFDIVANTLENLIHTVNVEQESPVYSAIIGMAGENTLDIITTAKSHRNKPETPITQKELVEISKRITDAANIEAYNQYTESTGNYETDLVNITMSTVYTKIDDQYISKEQLQTFNISGNTIEQALSMTFTPKNQLDTLKKIAKKANLHIIAVCSEMYAILKNLKKTDNNVTDCLLIDITNDYTEICIVFGGGIVANRILSIGYMHFAKELGLKMGITEEEANKVLHAYCVGTLNQTELDTVKTCLAEITNIWLYGIEILFSEFTGVRTFPTNLYVFGKGTMIKDTLEILHTTGWTRSIPFKGTPVIYRIQESLAEQFVHSLVGKLESNSWLKTVALPAIFNEI